MKPPHPPGAPTQKCRAPRAALPPLGLTLPAEGGAVFRVWAPNADAVSVIGAFNDWQADRHPLVRADDGTWFGTVPEAKRGDEYRYQLRRGPEEFKRADPRAAKVTNSMGNSIVWRPDPEAAGPAFTPPTLDQLVVYELHIGTFNAQKGRGPGDFSSAIKKLPYLRDLGINAVEVMPVVEFAGDFSWGYNPAHPYAVESIYGGPEGLQAFVKAAHEHGIAVILDVVYNHFGPGDLALWQFDGWNEHGLGGIYFYNDWRAETPWGQTRPDYGREEVRAYIHDNALMWLRDYRVDGLRWDMSVFIRTYRGRHGDPGDDLKEGWGLLQRINGSIREEFPRAMTIAEDLQDSEWLVKESGAGGAGFHTQWDAAFVHPVRATLIVAEDEQRNLDAVVNALKTRYEGDAFRRVVYTESHDEVANGKARLPSEIAPEAFDSYAAKKRSLLGAALVLTAPGVPMLFQGQEFLENEWFRDEIPLDWSKLQRFSGLHAFHRDLIALRRNLAGHTAGLSGQHLETHHVDHLAKIVGYRRWREGGAGDEVLVLINLSAQTVTDYAVGVPTGGTWRVRLNSDARAYDAEFGDHAGTDCLAQAEPLDGCGQRIRVSLGAYSAVIFSQDHAAP
ncbi:MAG: alpha amylase C-terminal domain-containing protein [Undibacterium sp.]|nr:alpha amylase C-terminal domain-containing protein [Opitutaceae bacterium]